MRFNFLKEQIYEYIDRINQIISLLEPMIVYLENEGVMMIRKLRKADAIKVADIWLNSNMKAHNFISAQYWKSNYEMVKEMLLQAEVYVYERNGEIQGFIGLNGEYIEGIFVCEKFQSQGIGKFLLDFIKKNEASLRLHVYQKNTRAIHFYQREGFEIRDESVDEATGEKDYVMIWQKCV